MTTTDRSPAECASHTDRLRKPREFRAVYNRGQRRVSRSFVVFVLPNGSRAVRFGLTTPRKLGKAHERNRIRRRVRELLRRVTCRPGVDVVINPRRSVLGRDFGELGGELRSILEESSG